MTASRAVVNYVLCNVIYYLIDSVVDFHQPSGQWSLRRIVVVLLYTGWKESTGHEELP